MALESPGSGWVHGLGFILVARKWLSPHGDGKERLGFRVYSVGFRSTEGNPVSPKTRRTLGEALNPVSLTLDRKP